MINYHITFQSIFGESTLYERENTITIFIFGDRNTSYFHRVAKIKSSSKPILFFKNGPIRIENPADIEAHVLDYFQNIFGVENVCIQNDLIAYNIPLLVMEANNIFLTKAPLVEEIKTMVLVGIFSAFLGYCQG